MNSTGSTSAQAPNPDLKLILWDFGGVFTASPFVGLDTYAASLGTNAKALRQIVFGDYGADSDHPWHKLERGEQSLADTAAQVGELAEQSEIEGFSLDGFFGSMSEGGAMKKGERSEVVDMVRQLKAAGFLNAIITNNIKEFSDAWRAMIPVDELFEHVVDSSAEGMRKPNPDIYLLALTRLGEIASAQTGEPVRFAPQQAVFLDDAEANVLAARELGMHGIKVELDPSSAMAELAQVTGVS